MMDMDETFSVVSRITRTNNWEVNIQLVRTSEHLSVPVMGALSRYGGELEPKGIFYRGTVYLICDRHEDAADLEATLLHEIAGHVGISRLFGPDIVQQLNRLYVEIGELNGLKRIARSRDIEFDISEVARRLSTSEYCDELRVRIMMDELLAHIAENPAPLDGVKAFFGMLRQWLRDRGFMNLPERGETDLLHILSRGRRHLEGQDREPCFAP